MKNALFSLLACLGLLGAGCTSRIGYGVEPGDVVPTQHRIPVRVAVLRFQDARPDEDKGQDSAFWRQWDVTKDERWNDEDVAAAISAVVAAHLRASGVFAEVAYEPIPAETSGPEVYGALRSKGYDAVLLGRLERFVGVRQQDLDRGAALLPLGFAGGAAGAVLGHSAGGLVVFRPVQLLQAPDGGTIWEGSARAQIDETSYLPADAGSYANEALRRALDDLCAQLDRDSLQIAGRLGKDRVEQTRTVSDPSVLEQLGSLLGGVVRQTGKLVEPIRKPVDDGVKWVTKPITGISGR